VKEPRSLAEYLHGGKGRGATEFGIFPSIYKSRANLKFHGGGEFVFSEGAEKVALECSTLNFFHNKVILATESYAEVLVLSHFQRKEVEDTEVMV
jgi:hypothetical protein